MYKNSLHAFALLGMLAKLRKGPVSRIEITNKMDRVVEFIIPMFLIAQHVSSDTPLIIRS